MDFVSDILGKDAPVEAAQVSGEFQREALQAAQEAQREAMEFQRQLLGREIENQLYNRLLGQQANQQGLAGYADQYGLTQATLGNQTQQLNMANQAKLQAMSGLQDYANMGRGAMPNLMAMTGRTPPPGMGAPVPFNVQAPQLTGQLPASHLGGFMQDYTQATEQANRYASQAPSVRDEYFPPINDLGGRLDTIDRILPSGVSITDLTEDDFGVLRQYLSGDLSEEEAVEQLSGVNRNTSRPSNSNNRPSGGRDPSAPYGRGEYGRPLSYDEWREMQ